MPSKRQLLTVITASVAASFVATNSAGLKGSPVALAADVASELPNTVSLVANAGWGREGRHLGFDTYAYPGDEIMRAWRANAPYEWVGYYLPAPCHKGRTWMGKREPLADMGWGMAVIYVGQQTWDKTPRGYETSYRTVRRTKYVTKRVKTYVVRSGKRVARYVTKRVPVKRTVRIPVHTRVDPKLRPLDDCNAQLVSGVRGKIEAQDAIKRTEAEGFPRGSVIFLDIEYMRATPSKMRDYYRAWTKQVLADGRYRPGFYAHTRNAALIYKDVKTEYARVGNAEEPPFWISGEVDEFTTEKAPHEVGHSFAAMWQGVLDVMQEWSGHELPIDVNVAAVKDPTHQFVTAD
jgi:glycoside hydrolase-like protein